MCSNTSRSSTCGDGSGCSGNGYGGNMLSPGSKNNKEKRPRVPKRGPGVAELEKILREQEKDKVEGFSSTCVVSNSKLSNMSPPPPPSLPPPSTPASVLSTKPPPMPTDFSPSICLPRSPHVPLAPNFDCLTPAYSPTTMSSIYGNGCHNSTAVTITLGEGGVSGSGVSAMGGPGFTFSEKAYFTATVSSTKLNDKRLPLGASNESNRPWPSTPLSQKRKYQYPSTVINPFLLSGSSSSSTSSAARLYSHPEPPSNQNVYSSYSSVLPEEQKTISMKLPYPFSSINSLDSPQFQFPPMSSFINRPDLTSSYDLDHNTALLTKSHHVTDFSMPNRNVKWDDPLELLSRKCNIPSPYGVCENGNFPTTSTPTISLPATRPFEGTFMSKYKAVPCQEKMEEYSNQNLESVGPYHQPYYSFLQEKDHKGMHERSHGLNSGRCEADSDSIDLSLKL